MTTTDASLANLFVSLLAVSNIGENLAGLESLFLSCLHGLQVAGSRSLCEIGIGAWKRHRHVNTKRPLIFVDRYRNQLKYVYAAYVPEVLKAATPARLMRETFGEILGRIEKASEPRPGGYHSPAEEVDAADCKDQVQAWNALGTAVASIIAVPILARVPASDAPLAAGVTAVGISLGNAIGNLIGIYGCPAVESAQDDATLTKVAEAAVSKAVADAKALIDAGQGSSFEATEQSVRGYAGALSGPSEAGDYSAPDPNNTIGDYMGNPDPSSPPPDPDTVEAAPEVDPSQPAPDPVGWAMPNPDDSGERHAWPPGIHWPTPPGGEMPNPDGTGPSGPVSFPNGAVFVPATTLTTIARVTGITVSGSTASNDSAPISSVQFSVKESSQQIAGSR